MHLLCPHCKNPIELVKLDPAAEVTCTACGSNFHIDQGSTAGWVEAAGTTVGRFTVLGTVGHGAFGTVFKARDPELDRVVAVKVPRRANVGEAAADVDRFLREARSAAQLRHPSIVSVHEVGLQNGQPYLVSDLIDGVTLADLLTARRPAPREAARLAADVADALEHAHGQGVVHRDVKPSNVMVRSNGSPVVMDFGLAKRDAGEVTMTLDGQVLGTPAYMSPEQARGEGHRVDGRSDVYSLGVILYQMLTGELPFRGNSRMLLHQVLHDEPKAPRSLNDKLPRDLETVCLKALAKEPDRRYPTAGELAADLRRFLAGQPVLARPVGRIERAVKWVKRNPVIAGAALAVVLALAGGTTVSTLKYLDAKQQKGIAQDKERQAKAEAAKAQRARAFLVSIFELADSQGQRGTMTARQILDDAEKSIPEKFADQPELQKELRSDVEGVLARITADAPLAMILEVRGPVQLRSARNPTRQAFPQALLFAGDQLSPGSDAQVQLVILSDLHKEWLKAGQEATVRRKGCEPADAVRERDQSPVWTFARLPKGTFYMGWDGQKGSARKTEIAEDFEIAAHDVTQGQWEAVMGSNPSAFTRVQGITDEERKLFPVEMVSWDDAQEFIKKLNEGEQKRGGRYQYRLPTEAEWEYACRGGATSEEECSYHFYFDKPTNDLSSRQANFNGNEPFGMAEKGPFLDRPTRVGAYPPNNLGLYDMHGNVWQMTSPQKGAVRRFRGGGWFTGGAYCRAGHRTNGAPEGRFNHLGFRLARVPRGYPPPN